MSAFGTVTYAHVSQRLPAPRLSIVTQTATAEQLRQSRQSSAKYAYMARSCEALGHGSLIKPLANYYDRIVQSVELGGGKLGETALTPKSTDRFARTIVGRGRSGASAGARRCKLVRLLKAMGLVRAGYGWLVPLAFSRAMWGQEKALAAGEGVAFQRDRRRQAGLEIYACVNLANGSTPPVKPHRPAQTAPQTGRHLLKSGKIAASTATQPALVALQSPAPVMADSPLPSPSFQKEIFVPPNQKNKNPDEQQNLADQPPFSAEPDTSRHGEHWRAVLVEGIKNSYKRLAFDSFEQDLEVKMNAKNHERHQGDRASRAPTNEPNPCCCQEANFIAMRQKLIDAQTPDSQRIRILAQARRDKLLDKPVSQCAQHRHLVPLVSPDEKQRKGEQALSQGGRVQRKGKLAHYSDAVSQWMEFLQRKSQQTPTSQRLDCLRVEVGRHVAWLNIDQLRAYGIDNYMVWKARRYMVRQENLGDGKNIEKRMMGLCRTIRKQLEIDGYPPGFSPVRDTYAAARELSPVYTERYGFDHQRQWIVFTMEERGE